MLVYPGFKVLKLACKALYAASTTSAFLPFIFSLLSLLQITVWATKAIKPSMLTPRSIFTTSPSCKSEYSFSLSSESDTKGE